MPSISEDAKNNKAWSYRGPDLKLYVRDVRDSLSRKRPFQVKSWATIKDAKDAIQACLHVPSHKQRLFYGPLLSSGKELPNHWSLHDAGIYRSGETLWLDLKRDNTDTQLLSATKLRTSQSIPDICVSQSLLHTTPKLLRQMLQHAQRAFALGIKPDLVMDGSGGSYFIHDVRKNKIAVFKPADEEPYAENNPRGYLKQPGQQDYFLREGVPPGEACIREVAAFLLDHDGFAGVPMTTLAEARHPAFNTNGARLKVAEGGASIGSHSLVASTPSSQSSSSPSKKVGSFQEFVKSECSMDDLSPSKIPAEQVHRIAILDIRIMNADRNSANLLCRRLPDNSLELVPIDHGYCLRSVCDVSWMDWCWLDWPQLKQPLSQKSRDYIRNLDIEADARILRERLNICEDAIDYFRASSALLKAGTEAGLSLYEIAVLCCRNDNLGEKPSLLERLTSTAAELANVAMENDQWHHATAMRAIADQLSPPRGLIQSRDRSGGSRFHRSASSGEFLVAAVAAAESVEEQAVCCKSSGLKQALAGDRSFPPMATQSSGSDTSTENGEGVEKDDIEEWAHGIIEDSFVTVHDIPNRAGRSTSITSSDDGSTNSNLSSSPKGFWHVRPGSTPPDLSDDGSVNWNSPCLSPRGFVYGANGPPVPPLDLGAASLLQTAPTVVDASVSVGRRQSVTFADVPAVAPRVSLPSSGPFLPPPASVGVISFQQLLSSTTSSGEFNASTDQPPPQTFSPLQISSPRIESSGGLGGMFRSKSHVTLRRSLSSGEKTSLQSTSRDLDDVPTNSNASWKTPQQQNSNRLQRGGDSSYEEDEFFRTYMKKFIDLVITREMRRLSSARSTS